MEKIAARITGTMVSGVYLPFGDGKKWHPGISGAIVVERGKNGSPDQSGAIVVVYPPFERGKNGTLGSVVVVYPPFVGGK